MSWKEFGNCLLKEQIGVGRLPGEENSASAVSAFALSFSWCCTCSTGGARPFQPHWLPVAASVTQIIQLIFCAIPIHPLLDESPLQSYLLKRKTGKTAVELLQEMDALSKYSVRQPTHHKWDSMSLKCVGALCILRRETVFILQCFYSTWQVSTCDSLLLCSPTSYERSGHLGWLYLFRMGKQVWRFYISFCTPGKNGFLSLRECSSNSSNSCGCFIAP